MHYTYLDSWLDGMFGSIGAVNTTNPTHRPVKLVIEEAEHIQTNPFEIQSVLSNRKKNAFTVVWADGTHTTVHCQSGDEWDDEKALAMCFTKKALGNKGNFNDKFNNALDIMKTIPAEPAPEKAHSCGCNPPCAECKCKEESIVDKALAKEFVKKSLEKAGNAASEANKAFTNMIHELAGHAKDEERPTPKNVYKVYIRIGNKSHFDGNYFTIDSLRKRVHELAEELYGRKPYYYRTWMTDGRMQIDFGSYSQFIEVEGIAIDEYAKN